MSDAALVGWLTELLATSFLVHRVSWEVYSFTRPMVHALRLRVLRELGFGDYAGQLAAACVGGRPVDLGRVYIETKMTAPWLRLWTEIEAEFGSCAIEKFSRAVPLKDPLQGVEWGVYSGFNVFAWFLAQAFGRPVQSAAHYRRL